MSAKPLGGLHFVITGEFGEDRVKIVTKLVSLGAVKHSGITAKTNLLVAGTDPGMEKIKLARSLGIRIADREWLKRALALGGYTLGEPMQVDNV
jgi:NAD-dependent DNA ligase